MTQFNHGPGTLELGKRPTRAEVITLATLLLGVYTGIAGMLIYGENKQTRGIYEHVNKAHIIETTNSLSSRPDDYCRNEIPDNASDAMAYKDACLQKMYLENSGLKEGRYLQTLKVPDIDEDGKVSSRH